MTPSTRKQTNLRLEDDLLEALQRVKDRDGIPISEQVRRAVRAWLESKGAFEKTAARRASTRRKA
jgi:hypothetical protein